MTTIRIAKRDKFTVMSRDAINDKRLSFKARGVLCWLLDKPNGWRVNAAEIALQSPDGRKAVLSGLRELRDAGYLVHERYQDERGHWNTVTTIYEEPNRSSVTEPRSRNLGEGPLLVELSVSTENNTPTPRADDSSFDAFWSEYPKKVGKPAARRAYRGACTRSTADKIYAGLQEWLPTWEKTESRFIPHPATWLNQDRWNDAPEANGSWELDGVRMSEFTR